jgi:hypothetical protein
MTYCESCGSTSFDELGFCRGCGARLPGYAPTQTAPAAQHKSAYETYLPNRPALDSTKRPWTIWGFAQPDVRNVWVAVLLALFLGPFGLTYATYLGAFVMLLVSAAATFYCGRTVNLLIFPACAIWAYIAARRANSIY